MQLISKLSVKEYSSQMRRRVRLFPHPFSGGLSGIVIGRFFSVANRADAEWNRRITHECCRAIGYITEEDGQTVVKFFHTYGHLSVFWLIFWTVIAFIISLKSNDLMIQLIFAPISSLVICLITGFEHFLTDNGQAVKADLHRFLEAPDEYYG